MKLYEKILKKVGILKDPPSKYKFIIDQPVTIDTLDYRNFNFFVKEIRDNQVSVKKHFTPISEFVDYVLIATGANNGSDLLFRLRMVNDKAIVLSLYDELTYSDDFLNICNDESGKFLVEFNGQSDEYWRVQDVKLPYYAKVNENKYEFWDFSRKTNIEGVDVEQFLFIEMDKSNGWFQLWLGAEVNSEKVY